MGMPRNAMFDSQAKCFYLYKAEEDIMSRKRISRRELLHLSAFAAGGLMLSACAPAAIPTQVAAPTSTTASATAATQTQVPGPTSTIASQAAVPITLQWWHSWGEGSTWGIALKKISEAYTKLHPNVTIQLGYGKPGTSDAAKTALAAGTPPDLLETNETATLAIQGVALQLDDMIAAANLDRSDRWDAGWKKAVWDSKTYSLYFENDMTCSLQCNLSLYRQAGLDPTALPVTWNDLKAVSDKITQKDSAGNIKVLGFRPLDGIGGYYTWWLLAAGAKEYWDTTNNRIPVDTPEMRAVIEYIVSFYQTYGPQNMSSFSSSNGGWTGSADSAFIRKVQANIVNGSWGCGDMSTFGPDIDWKPTWVPTIDGKHKIQTIGGHGNTIPKGTKNINTAFDLALFIGGYKPYDFTAPTIMWNTSSGFLLSKSFLKSIDPSKYKNLKWYFDSVDQADILISLGDEYPLVTTYTFSDWGPLVESVAFGKQKLDDALAEEQKKMDTATKELFKH
jgi:ABC-type glycerol-3-phosphate transport system substrate-binding protein